MAKSELGTGILAQALGHTVTLPIDIVKTHMQLIAMDKKVDIIRALPVLRDLISKKGVLGLYVGYQASILRSALFTATRSPLYLSLLHREQLMDKYGSAPMWKKTIFNMISGAVGYAAATPGDLVITRLQTDDLQADLVKRGYRNSFQAIQNISQKEGLSAFRIGIFPNALKGAGIAFGMMGMFDHTKEWFARLLGDIPGIWTAAFICGSVSASLFSLPFDNIKTKMQYQLCHPELGLKYKSTFDCFAKTLKREGFYGFYVGFWVQTFRYFAAGVIVSYTVEIVRKISHKDQ